MRIPLIVLSVLSIPAAAMAAEVVNVPQFRSIALHDGGTVVVRPGTTQRVTLIEGTRNDTQFSVRNGTLMIENCTRPIPNIIQRCPPNYHLRVEIVTPPLQAMAVSDGGILRTEGTFAPQEKLAASVHDGGMLDIRSHPANDVAAAVHDGGRVWLTARSSVAASVRDGGHITYWGDPASVAKSVHDGGAVSRGDPADADTPLVIRNR